MCPFLWLIHWAFLSWESAPNVCSAANVMTTWCLTFTDQFIVIGLHMLKQLYIVSINSTWPWWILMSLSCLMRLSSIWLVFLHLYSPGIFICSILVIYLPDFGIKVIMTSQNELGSILSSSNLWKSLWSVGVNSSF